MMSKVNVNGPSASPVYKYLKKVAGPSAIGWNFATVRTNAQVPYWRNAF